MKLSIIIPALNEETTIAETIHVAKKAFPEAEIVVVDDGSTDGTAENARKCGTVLIRHSNNRGKGRAMSSGAKAASGEALLFLDADILNLSTKMLKKIVLPVLKHDAEASIGTFESPHPQTFTELVYRPLVGLAFPEVNKAIQESPLSGQRAIIKKV
ncbi:MAG: glycosyltransferase family 2 protein, partial [Candidatus Micrarchaeota archaeon]